MIGQKRDYANTGIGEASSGDQELQAYVKKSHVGMTRSIGVANSGGRFSVGFSVVSPGSTGQYHRTGTVLLVYRRKNVRSELMMDPQMFNYLCLCEAIAFNTFYDTSRDKKVAGWLTDEKRRLRSKHDSDLKQTFSTAYNENDKRTHIDREVFLNMRKTREIIAVAGIRSDEPNGFSSNVLTSYQTLPHASMYAIGFQGRSQIHSGYFDPPYDIGVGASLWCIIKKVPMNWCEFVTPHGTSFQGKEQDYVSDSKNLTTVILFYVSPHGGGAPPVDKDLGIYKDIEKQPALYSPEYKVFDDPDDPKSYRLEMGICTLLGKSIERVPATNDVPYNQRRTVRSYLPHQIIKTNPIDVFLSIRPVYK